MLVCATLLVLGAFMKSLWIAVFLAALPLGGCCLFQSGCNAPIATARTDWEGLDQPAVQEPRSAVPKQRSSSRVKSQAEPSKWQDPKSQDSKSQDTKSQDNASTEDSWQEEEARQQSDDLRLKRRLIICQGCAMSGSN
jgi:hypothetical protein